MGYMVCQYPSSPKCSPYRTRQPELSPGRDYTIIYWSLRSLHWLSVEKRITFKLLILAFKCNKGVAPQYLLDIVKCVYFICVYLYQCVHAHRCVFVFVRVSTCTVVIKLVHVHVCGNCDCVDLCVVKKCIY